MKKLLLLLSLAASVSGFAKSTLQVSFPHEGLNLNGRLILPDAATPQPVILIAPGTGANNRDAEVYINGSNFPCLYPGLVGDTVRPYRDLSEALSDSGYAVFTFDKLEYTYPNPGAITFDKLWMQIRSAVQHLKTRTDIDADNIIIIGHSEGSSLAPYVARTEPAVTALISLAGPRRPLDTMLAYQIPYIAQTCGGDVASAEQAAAQVLQYCADVRDGNYNSSTPPLFGVPASIWEQYFNVVDSVAIHYNLSNRPTLFIGLGDDFNVPPATELSRFQAEITIPADFYLLPGLNHFLTTANDPRVSEVLTDTIVQWLRAYVPLGVASAEAGQQRVEVQFKGAHLSVHGVQPIRRVRIFDLSGRMLLSEEAGGKSSFTTSVSELAGGIYVVEVLTVKGRVVQKVSKS